MLCEGGDSISSVTSLPRLNPYSIGICSVSARQVGDELGGDGLNPYSIGICSVSFEEILTSIKKNVVLILILLEYAL